MARPVRGWSDDESGLCAETTVARMAMETTALHRTKILLIDSKHNKIWADVNEYRCEPS